MPDTPSTREEKVRAFWARFAEKVQKSGIKAPFDRWVVRRAEQYVASLGESRLADQRPADVDAYLSELGRNPAVKGWQVRQAADAIRMLHETAGAAWLAEVDWAHWAASSRELGQDHPTVARDYGGSFTPARAIEGDALPFALVRETHGALLGRVSALARVKGLAIRTEQTYLHWIMRFIGFHQNRDPEGLGVEDVSAFLEHLAVARRVSASTQNLALNALVFLYREIFRNEGLDFGDFARARRQG